MNSTTTTVVVNSSSSSRTAAAARTITATTLRMKPEMKLRIRRTISRSLCSSLTLLVILTFSATLVSIRFTQRVLKVLKTDTPWSYDSLLAVPAAIMGELQATGKTTAKEKINLVIGVAFNHKKDPQRLKFVQNDLMKYVGDWYKSIIKHENMHGVLLGNMASPAWMDAINSVNNTRFHMVHVDPIPGSRYFPAKLQNFSINDLAFYVMREYVREHKDEIGYVLFTDVSDVVFLNDPFEYMKYMDKITGRPEIYTMEESIDGGSIWWFKDLYERCYTNVSLVAYIPKPRAPRWQRPARNPIRPQPATYPNINTTTTAANTKNRFVAAPRRAAGGRPLRVFGKPQPAAAKQQQKRRRLTSISMPANAAENRRQSLFNLLKESARLRAQNSPPPVAAVPASPAATPTNMSAPAPAPAPTKQTLPPTVYNKWQNFMKANNRQTAGGGKPGFVPRQNVPLNKRAPPTHLDVWKQVWNTGVLGGRVDVVMDATDAMLVELDLLLSKGDPQRNCNMAAFTTMVNRKYGNRVVSGWPFHVPFKAGFDPNQMGFAFIKHK